MAIDYNPPGVTIKETTQQSVNTLLGTPDDVCLIGYGTQFEYYTMANTAFTGLKAIDLGIPSTSSVEANPVVSIYAINPLSAGSGTSYDETTGYTVAKSNFTYSSGKIRRHVESIGVPTQAITSTTINTVKITLDAGKTLPTVSASNPGYVFIDDELITYTGITPDPSETQTFTVNATTGKFKITYGSETTTAISVGANAATVETALKALASIGDSDVVVTRTGSVGSYQYSLAFQGTLAGTNVPNVNVTSDTTDVLTYNEVQTVTVVSGSSGTPTYTLKYGSSGTPTAAIAYDASGSDVATALNASGILPTGGTVTVDRTGTSGSYQYAITFGGTLTSTNASSLVSDATNLVSVDEQQTVTLSGVSSGNYTLKYGSSGTPTASIAYNATNTDVASALNASGVLPTGGSVTVTRSGSSGSYVYTVTFGGTLAGTDVTQLQVGTAPSVGSVGIATSVPGIAKSATVATVTTGQTVTTPSSSIEGATSQILTGCTRGVDGTTAATHTTSSVVKQASSTSIPENTYLKITWRHTPSDHYNARLYTSANAISARFGQPFDPSDQSVINSPLSLAASLAIMNGATRVWVAPLFKLDGSGNPMPCNGTTDVANVDLTWGPTLDRLRDKSDIGVIVPVVGQNAVINDQTQLNIFSKCQQYLTAKKTEDQEYAILVAGEDSTVDSTKGVSATRQNHALALSESDQTVLVSPSIFKTTSPNGTYVFVGGQYAAAAVAGRTVSSAAKSLTRKSIIGFNYVDPLSKDVMKSEGKNGLLVIENTGDNIQVRHGITVNTDDVSKSELSVVRAKQRMISRVLRTIDTQIIGNIVADNNAPLVVERAVAGVLRTMTDDGEIVGFGDVIGSISAINPTVISVEFSYRPAFPVNYINISFAVDLTTGGLTLTNTNTTGANNG